MAGVDAHSIFGTDRMSDKNEQDLLLLARLGDAVEKSRRGSVAVLPFLTPRDRRRAEAELRRMGAWDAAWFFGGYAEAERACLFLVPEYLLGMIDSPLSQCDTDAVKVLVAEELENAVCAVRIKGSGYRTLSHRDYLGSVLGLGIERDAIGDIAVQNSHEAVLFCGRTLSDFLIGSLSKVGTDTVKCSLYEIDERFTDGRSYRPISDTIASPRLDCVVAALTNLSRDDAQRSIRQGLVEVDFEEEIRVDRLLTPPMTVSVRGFGRYILRAFDGETRKGRLRLRADQLV